MNAAEDADEDADAPDQSPPTSTWRGKVWAFSKAAVEAILSSPTPGA